METDTEVDVAVEVEVAVETEVDTEVAVDTDVNVCVSVVTVPDTVAVIVVTDGWLVAVETAVLVTVAVTVDFEPDVAT